MALSLTMAAFRDASPEGVLASLRARLELSGYRLTPATSDEWEFETSLSLNAPRGRWCTLQWPGPFLLADKMTKELSAALRAIAAFVQINRESSWTHLAFASGELRDEFNSFPDAEADAFEYITDNEFPVDETKARWRGSPERLGRLFGADPAVLASYMVYQGHKSFDPGAKACPDDGHALGDPWIVVDFWKRLGIPWPSDEAAQKSLFNLTKAR